jgi:hypothetical protein
MRPSNCALPVGNLTASLHPPRRVSILWLYEWYHHLDESLYYTVNSFRQSDVITASLRSVLTIKTPDFRSHNILFFVEINLILKNRGKFPILGEEKHQLRHLFVVDLATRSPPIKEDPSDGQPQYSQSSTPNWCYNMASEDLVSAQSCKWFSRMWTELSRIQLYLLPPATFCSQFKTSSFLKTPESFSFCANDLASQWNLIDHHTHWCWGRCRIRKAGRHADHSSR